MIIVGNVLQLKVIWQIKHEAIQKVCHQLNGIFHLIHFCQFYSTTSPVLFTKNKKL